MCWWRSKYVKDIVAVYVYGSIGWGVDNFVGAEVYISYVDEVNSDIDDEVGEGFESEVGGEFVSWYCRSWRWYQFSLWHLWQ